MPVAWSDSSAIASGVGTDGCPAGGAFGAELPITVAIFIALWWIAWRAWKAPARSEPILRHIGRTLQFLAAMSYLISLVSYFGYAHRDTCGRRTGTAGELGVWLTVSAVILFTVGLIMTTASEWAAIFAVAVVDLGLAALSGVSSVPHQRLVITILLAHGVCTLVAGWWSWRVHLGPSLARAKGSEAGRILTAGWIILWVLQIGLSDEHGETRSVADTQFLALFVVTAIGLVMGTGYTRYSEARVGLGPDQRPGFPRTRRRMAALTEWAVRYGKWW